MPDNGRQLRDEALERVERRANAHWKVCANRLLSWMATRYDLFTTDDVWSQMAARYPNAKTHEPRALGAMMRNAAKSGLIESTDRTRDSRRPECHSRPVRVWRSLRYHSD